MVCFRTGATEYCLPVESTRAVRANSGLVALPDARQDVAGLMPGNPPLTVLSSLGAQGSHVLVLDVHDRRFGVLVGEVTGLRRINDGDVVLAPEGEGHALVSGTVQTDDGLMLIADADALARRL